MTMLYLMSGQQSLAILANVIYNFILVLLEKIKQSSASVPVELIYSKKAAL